MVMHEIEAHFCVKAAAVAEKQASCPDGLPADVQWFRHFDGFTLSPWGGVAVHPDRVTLTCHTRTPPSSRRLRRKLQ